MAGVLVLGLGAASCRACVGEEELASSEGPPRVRLVRSIEAAGGRMPGFFDMGQLVIESTPTRRLSVCRSPKKGALVVEPAGKRIAVRCNDEPWQLIELGAGERVFTFCDLSGDPSKEWSRAPSLERHGADAVACAGDKADALDAALAELGERKLPAAIEALLLGAAGVELADANDSQRAAFDAAWLEARGALDSPARARLDRALCQELAGTSPRRHAADLAIRLCDIWAPGLAAPLREQVLSLREHETTRYRALWHLGLVRLMRDAPVQAAERLCTNGSAPLASFDPLRFAALAHTRTRCPGAGSALAALTPPCDRAMDCEGALCSEAQLRARLDRWLDAHAAEKPPRAVSLPMDLPAPAIALAFRYAQGPLDAAFVQQNARRHYARPAAEGPPCHQVSQRGERCTCAIAPEHDLCAAADATTIELPRCLIAIDDRARSLGPVTHRCVRPDELLVGAQMVVPLCASDADCCEKSACVADAAGERRCTAL